MILKRLLAGAAVILFAVLALLLLTGKASYPLYSALGGWGFIMVNLSFMVGKPKAEKPALRWTPDKQLYIAPGLNTLNDDELAAVKARFAESVKRREPQQLLETWDARVRLIEQASLNGTISMKTASERYQAMINEWYKATSPAHQVEALSDKYGLPVETPVQKPDLPQLVARDLPPDPPRDEPDDDVPTVEESLEGYVPEGQDDLTRDLKAYVHRQVLEARKTPWTASRKREWHVGPEWAEQVRKLPAFVPGKRPSEILPGTLNSFPVVVGEQFGTPELTAI